MDIKAAVATAPDQPFKVKTVQLENPRDDEILVKIKGVGICHTDLVVKWLPIRCLHLRLCK